MRAIHLEAAKKLAEKAEFAAIPKIIDKKVLAFENWLNGKALPFFGLHGGLLMLIYLIDHSLTYEEFFLGYPSQLAVALAVAALFCGFGIAASQFSGRAQYIPGGVAMGVCLSLMAVLVLPSGGAMAMVQFAIALVLSLTLLFFNATARVADYEFNAVWIYLPLIFLVVGQLPGNLQMFAAAALYGPAIYVKFRMQPGSGKVPLGFSALAYLTLIVSYNAGSEGVIAIMVLLVLALFVISSFRMRNVIGSSLRHFLVDAITVGLWGLLVSLVDHGFDGLIVWGIGVAAYQSALILRTLRSRSPSGRLEAHAVTKRDAHLVWLQIAALAIFGELVINSLLEQRFGIEKPYVGMLLIVAPFIWLFYRLRAPFLALSTRLLIANCLLLAAVISRQGFEERYIDRYDQQVPGSLRAVVADTWDSELMWAAFAFAVAWLATLRIPPDVEVAWWRGLIRPRHMVLVRRIVRLTVANASRIPVVGGLLSTTEAFLNWMRYASGDGRGRLSRDGLLVGVHIYAVAITVLLLRFGNNCCDVIANPALTTSLLIFGGDDLPFVIACCLWGTLLYLRGVLTQDCLARFLATVLVILPLATFNLNNTLEDTVFLAQMTMVCCFALFGFGLLRRLVR